MTTRGATSDDKVDIMETLGFQCMCGAEHVMIWFNLISLISVSYISLYIEITVKPLIQGAQNPKGASYIRDLTVYAFGMLCFYQQITFFLL